MTVKATVVNAQTLYYEHCVSVFLRKSKQCFKVDEDCDGIYHCRNQEDEKECLYQLHYVTIMGFMSTPAPAVIHMDSYGYFTMTRNPKETKPPAKEKLWQDKVIYY